MSEIKLLALLNDYYSAQRNVVTCMMWAMEDFERGHNHVSWVRLIEWCECKDEREELWGRLKHNYAVAMMLKEGYAV